MDPQGCRELGLFPGWDLPTVAAALLPLPAAVAEVKAGAMGTSAASFGLAELLLVSVLQERTQGTAVSLGMAEADRDCSPVPKLLRRTLVIPALGRWLFCLCSRTVISFFF